MFSRMPRAERIPATAYPQGRAPESDREGVDMDMFAARDPYPPLPPSSLLTVLDPGPENLAPDPRVVC